MYWSSNGGDVEGDLWSTEDCDMPGRLIDSSGAVKDGGIVLEGPQKE